MAKIYGLFGAMSGKVADVVMSVRNGQQIVRKYQPVVSNPKTQNQFTTRARFKLLSQLSAIMASSIAIRKSNGVSSRNIFTKLNFPISTFESNEAKINLNLVQLTNSSIALPNLSATRGESNINVHIDPYQFPIDIDRVVYVGFVKDASNHLRWFGSAVSETEGATHTWDATLPLANFESVIYAYGIKFLNENARTRFGNIQAITAETVAKLIVSNDLNETDIQLTMTRGITLAEATTQSVGNRKKVE